MPIVVKVVGTEEVVAKMRGRSASVSRLLMAAVQTQAIRVQARVKSQKLVGGNPLHSRTGKLRRSIHATTKQEGDLITGFVGSNVKYAAVHELGLLITVRAHLRMVTQAWGKTLKNPHKVNVRSHEVQYPERSFLRSSLNELSPSIKEALTSAVNRALRMPA